MLITGYKAVTSGVGRTTRGYRPASGTLGSTTLGDTVVPPSLWVSQQCPLDLCGQLRNSARIPAGAIYPLYTTLLTSVTGASIGQNSTVNAGVITIGVAMLLAMLLATPLFLRKYVVWHP